MFGVLESATKNYFTGDANSVKPLLSDARWTALTILVSSVMLLPLTIQFIAMHATTFRLSRRRHLSRKKASSRNTGDGNTRTGGEHMSEFESLHTSHHVVQLQDKTPTQNEHSKAPPTLQGGKPNDIMGLGATGVVYDSGCCTLADDTSILRLKGGSPEPRHGDGPDNRREEMSVTNIIITAALWQMYFGRWACVSGTMQLFNERAYSKAPSTQDS